MEIEKSPKWVNETETEITTFGVKYKFPWMEKNKQMMS